MIHQSLPPDLNDQFSVAKAVLQEMGLEATPQSLIEMAEYLWENPGYLEGRKKKVAADLWKPRIAAQKDALNSEAFEVYFGGQAGGGKTDFILGTSITQHQNSILFRQEYKQWERAIARSYQILAGSGARFNANQYTWRDIPGDRVVTFAAIKHRKDVEKYMGRDHDLYAFDEVATLQEDYYRSLIAWARTTDPNQRVRVIACGNPPLSQQAGGWVKKRWGAWVDARHPNPALPGELRWFINKDGIDTEVDGPKRIKHGKEWLIPKSRTFIPARLEDNRFLGEDYRSTLQMLDEPMRSQLLYGDFDLMEVDQERQVIPTHLVKAAQGRWEEMDGPEDDEPLRSIGGDVSRGGDAQTVLCKQYGNWFAPLIKYPATESRTGNEVVALIEKNLGDDEKYALIVLDVAGIGASPHDILSSHNYKVDAFNAASRSSMTDKSGRLRFANRRAEAWWKFREALSEDSGEELAIPPDNELYAELIAPIFDITTQGIRIEDKEAVKKRLGRSTDSADAMVMCYNGSVRGAINFF